MSAGRLLFIDTNILLYSYDAADSSKQRAAQLWLDCLWDRNGGRLSWQVLNEFYANATRKIGVNSAFASAAVEIYAEWRPSGFTLEQVRRAWHWKDEAGVSYWDGLILAAAEEAGCKWLLSEDFQQGRKYGIVQVINPFRTDPAKWFENHAE